VLTRRKLLWVAALLLPLTGAGGWLFAGWWFGNPDALYFAAQEKVRKGDEAFQAGQFEQAKKQYEAADHQLEQWLPDAKAPLEAQGWFLRYRAQAQLSAILTKEGAARKESGDNLPSTQLAASSWAALSRAALDPDCVEADAVILSRFFRDDTVENFAMVQLMAENLVKLPPDQWQRVPDPINLMLGARFVLAWVALHDMVPDPEECLGHLRASDELRQMKWEEARAKDPEAKPQLPRWRVVALEVQALTEKLKHLRKTRPAAPGARDKEQDDLAQQLRNRVGDGLQRLQQEKDDILPGQANVPAGQLVNRSPTEVRGLLDFLVLAVEQSATAQETAERAALALEVCDRLTGADNAAGFVLRQTAGHVGVLSAALDRPPAVRQLTEGERAQFGKRIEHLAARTTAAGAPLTPAGYLELARTARHSRELTIAEGHTLKGLEVAAASGLPATDETVVDLHTEAAWILLLQKKTHEVEQHLESVRGPRKRQGVVRLIEGLVAVLDGRPEAAVAPLRAAAQDAVVGQSMLPYLGMAYAHLALGQNEPALKQLEKLQPLYKRLPLASPDEQLFAAELLPGPDALNLELVRCHLALGHLNQGLEYRDQLQDKAARVTAALLLHRTYLARARTAQAQNLAADAYASAQRELETARQLGATDLRLAWSEAVALRTQGRADKADDFFDGQARLAHGPGGMLARARWLQLRGRFDDADAILASLHDEAPEVKRALQVLGVQRELVAPPAGEAAPLFLVLDNGTPERTTEEILLAAFAGLHADRSTGLGTLARFEEEGLAYFWQGQLAQGHGDHKEALRAYERSMQFAAFKVPSQRGMLASLLALSSRESPKMANDLSIELLRVHPTDPALLLAYAETARLLDNVRGRSGMEGALKLLETGLNEQHRDPALGAYYLARGWVSVGRGDLARGEIERALKANAQHEPTLRLAIPLALATEEWGTAARWAEALQGVASDPVEPRLWLASALAGQGDTEPARRTYLDLVARFPDRAAGYLGMAEILERAGDLEQALTWVMRWRDRAPEDLPALRMQVRLLAARGRSAEAVYTTERLLAAGTARGADAGCREAEVTRAVAAGFQDAGDLEQAAAWARRGLAALENCSATERAERALPLHLALGIICQERAEQEKDAARHAEAVKQAIASFQAVYAQSPGHVAAGKRLAWLLYKESNDAEGAYNVLEQARLGRASGKPISGDRLDLAFLDELGTVAYAAAHHLEAVILFREAASRYDRDPRVFFHLGRALAALKQSREAQENLTKAIRLGREKAEQTQDKGRWLRLIDEATRSQQGLSRAG
jgi:tetratricopeptide (TPR) repeat protein